jgi:hypothetical protein
MITYVYDTARTAINTSILIEDRQEEAGGRWLLAARIGNCCGQRSLSHDDDNH